MPPADRRPSSNTGYCCFSDAGRTPRRSQWVANYILHLAQNLSIADQSFAGFYLLTHGIVKLFLVSAVMLGKPYPLFMAALVLLIVYQSYQLTLGLSATLIFLTVLDLAVLGLTWHEYRLVMRGM